MPDEKTLDCSQSLLEEIWSTSNSLLAAVKANGGIALDIKAELEVIKAQAVTLRNHYQP